MLKPSFSDLMLVIRKTRVDVYCNPINWHYFLPYLSHWTNVAFHCLQEGEVVVVPDQRFGIDCSAADAVTHYKHCIVGKIKDVLAKSREKSLCTPLQL